MSETVQTIQTVLTLVRHGETPANQERVWHGSTDTPLSDRGREQARRVGAYLAGRLEGVPAVYSSELQRARHTAEAIGAALSAPHRLDPALAEYHLGSWEGRPYRELMHDHGFFERIARDPDFAPAQAESPRSVATRVADSLRRIAAAHPGEQVVVVTHGMALCLGLDWLLDGELCVFRRVMDNCAVAELVLEPAPALRRFNEVEHLAELWEKTPGSARGRE